MTWTMAAGLALTTLAGGCNKGGTSGTTTPASGGETTSAGTGPVATVNGQDIDREEFHRFLEVASGERALPQLIDHQLVMQDLKKQNLTIDEADVKAGVDRLVEQRTKMPGPATDQFNLVYKSEAGRAAIERNIRQDLAINAILIKDIKVDDAALKTWFDKNHARYDTPAQAKIGLLLATTRARADLMAKQLAAKTKTFAQLVAEQKKANDPIASQGSIEQSPTSLPLSDLGPMMGPLAQKLPVGGVSSVLSLGQKTQPVFGIMRLVSRQEVKKADLTTMKSQIEMDYKLEQIARRVVKENPQNPPFEQTVIRTENALAQQMAQSGESAKPTYRDVLGYILNGEKQKLLAQLHEKAQVKIPDAIFANVGKAYGPQAPSPGTMGMPGGPGSMPSGAPSGAPSGGSMSSGGATPRSMPSGSTPPGAPSGSPSGAPATGKKP